MDRYTFTRKQLERRLREAIGLMIEYRDQHDRDEATALEAAVAEIFEGLRFDRELHALDGEPLLLQEGE